MEKIIYEAKFSEKTEMAEGPDLSLYDAETQEFINLSIAYAKKSKSDIVISRENNSIRANVCVAVGLFFGGFKKTFLNFVTKSDDFLILPINKYPNFAFRISANYDMMREE